MAPFQGQHGLIQEYDAEECVQTSKKNFPLPEITSRIKKKKLVVFQRSVTRLQKRTIAS